MLMEITKFYYIFAAVVVVIVVVKYNVISTMCLRATPTTRKSIRTAVLEMAKVEINRKSNGTELVAECMRLECKILHFLLVLKMAFNHCAVECILRIEKQYWKYAARAIKKNQRLRAGREKNIQFFSSSNRYSATSGYESISEHQNERKC